MLFFYTLRYINNTMKTTLSIAVISLGAAVASGQLRNWRDHPAIQYSTAQVHDPVEELNQKLAGGAVKLSFEDTFGYLKSVLTALKVPIESQALVFSKTSLQSILISPDNPRAIFFNDSVTVAWVR